jgi:hypothetical protein
MATVIQIKRSTGVSAPAVSDLSEGELAYVQDRSNSGAGAKLYIESVDQDNSTPLIQAIGGKYYTDILAGSSATPSNFKVGNGSTAGASVSLMEDSDNGTNFVALKAADTLGASTTFTLPTADGSANQVIATDGSGNLSFLSTTSTLAGATDSDISSPTSAQIPVHDGTDSFDNVSISGDATLAANGALTIANSAVETAMIADDAVTLDKLADALWVTQAEGIGSNDNDTTIPTSAAVKDYVDSLDRDDDLNIAGSSGTGTVDLDTQSLTVTGTANEVETSASGQTITVGLPNDVTIANNLTVSGNLISDDITTATLTTSGNLTVTGNLTVNGTTTTVNSSTVNIADPVFEIGDDSSDDNLDRGIKFKYNSGGAKIGFFGMDDTDGSFVALTSATDSSSVFSGTAMGGKFGNLTLANASMSGSIDNYAGSAPTDGQLLIGDTSSGVFDAATLTAGEGLDITNGAGAITLSAEDATDSNKGIASFSGSYFTVSSGDVAINDATTTAKGIASFHADNFTVSSGSVTVTAIDGGTF